MQSADKLTLEPAKQVYSTSKMLMRWFCASEFYAKSALSDHARSPTASEPPTDRLWALSQTLLALFLPTCPQPLSLEAALHLLYAGSGPFISLCLWFPSVVVALAAALPATEDLCWPTASDFATATWLNVSCNTMVIITETGTGLKPDQGHVCLIYTNLNPTTMLIPIQNEGE